MPRSPPPASRCATTKPPPTARGGLTLARSRRTSRNVTDTLQKLEQTIRDRRLGDPSQSYVAKLTARGRGKMAQKLGEEAVECVIAAMADDREGLIGEGADLLFHLGVLLADCNLSFDDLMRELDRREGVSGIAEKAARPKD